MWNILVNKSPKILLVILILYGLSINANSLFGVSYISDNDRGGLPYRSVMEAYYKKPITLQTTDSVCFEVKDSLSDNVLGYAVFSYDVADKYQGYGGQTPLVIFISNKGVIESVQMLANHETPRFIERLHKDGFYDKFVGKTIDDKFADIHAVSGATYSSNAVKFNVVDALAYVSKSGRVSAKVSLWGYIKQFAVLAVVVGALLSMLFPGPAKRFRLLLLAASIGVLGIWQGAFISLELIYKWVIYGTSLTERFAMAIILFLAVSLPLLLNKSFYCQWLCPFGAAQELAGKLFYKKIKISSRVLTIFRWVRRLILVGCVILLIFVSDFNLSNVEPFTFFMIRVASVSAIVIAGVSLLASLVFYRPWCRLLCPTGEVLSLLSRRIKYKK